MIQAVQAPNQYSANQRNTIFLAGSIQMGKAVLWQQQLIELIKQHFGTDDLLILNPRRDDWDRSWEQDKKMDLFTNKYRGNWKA